jgi:PAS domain S-box-containing protein
MAFRRGRRLSIRCKTLPDSPFIHEPDLQGSTWTPFVHEDAMNHPGAVRLAVADGVEISTPTGDGWRYRHALEQAEVGLAWFDCDLHMREINAHACALLGRDPAHVIGSHISELATSALPAEMAREVVRQFREALDDDKMIRVDAWPIRRTDRSGELEYYQWQIRPIGPSAGEHTGLLCTFADVTPFMRVQDELHASRTRYLNLAEGMPQMVWTARADGGVDYFNQNWYDYTGLNSERSLGDGWRAAIHPDDRARCFENISRALASGGQYEFESRIRRALDGSYRWFLIRALSLRDHGTAPVRQWIGTCTDIDDRKRAESEALRSHAAVTKAAAELAHANDELEQFAYSSSHDLQEPLRMVTGYLALLKRKHAEKLDQQAISYLDQAVDGAKRMQLLIHDLLEYSRVGRTGDSESVAAATALRQATTNLAAAIGDCGAEIDAGPLPTVHVDQTMLAQVFQNLIGNALKFRREVPPRISISAERDGKLWRFAVRDNGIGIEAMNRTRIFDVFQRLHSRNEYPGTGIGLAICKKAV